MISIIIPIWNGQKYIGDCLVGMLNQTYKNFEVIVVNDGSTDKSESVLNDFKKVFTKAEINYKIINQENMGAPVARNKGYEQSIGDYLLFCDADVILRKNALQVFQDNLKNSKASYTYSSHIFGKKLFKFWKFDANKLKEMPYIHSTSLIKKSDFPKKGWDEKLKRLQDWDLFLSMLDEGFYGLWINEVLFEIKTGGTMSEWIPSFFYKFLPFLPSVKKYNQAVSVIKNKHKLI